MKLIDLHCDTIDLCMEDKEHLGIGNNQFCVDIEKLKQADSLAQFFALYVNIKEHDDPDRYCLEMLDKFYEELNKNKEDIAFAGSLNMLENNLKQGRLSAFLSIEEGGVLNGKLHNLRNFYRLGVRMMTLIWNHPNELGYPNYKFEYKDKGLTDFGKQVVWEMNKLGMIIDVSHASDAVFYDAARLSDKPFIASHSNAREITYHARNLTDDMIKTLSEKGGVTGINFEAMFLGQSSEAKISDMIKHIKHIYNIGGIEVLAIGTDFDGTTTKSEIKNIGEMEKLHHALERNGFSQDYIERIFYKNALRVIKDVLK